MINIIVDIVIILLLILGGFVGYKKGFIKSLKRPIRLFGGFILSFSLCNAVSVGIIEPIVKAPISTKIEEYVFEHFMSGGEYPTIIRIAAALMDVDLSSAESVEQIINSVLDPTVHFISVIIAFVLIYILSKLFLSLLVSLVSLIFDKTILSMPNKIIGCIFCTLATFVFLWMGVSVLDFIVKLPVFEGTSFATNFTGGAVYSFFRSFSPLDLLLSF